MGPNRIAKKGRARILTLKSPKDQARELMARTHTVDRCVEDQVKLENSPITNAALGAVSAPSTVDHGMLRTDLG
jgi:hypothetical protein